jgi:hypothetical protein
MPLDVNLNVFLHDSPDDNEILAKLTSLEFKMEEFDRVKAAVEESNTLMEGAVNGLTTMASEVRRLADEVAAAAGDRAKLADLTERLRDLGTVADQGNDALQSWMTANVQNPEPAPAPAPDAPAPAPDAPAPAPADGSQPAPADGSAPVDGSQPAPADGSQPAPADGSAPATNPDGSPVEGDAAAATRTGRRSSF